MMHTSWGLGAHQAEGVLSNTTEFEQLEWKQSETLKDDEVGVEVCRLLE